MKIERRKRSQPASPLGGAMPREAVPETEEPESSGPTPEADSVALSSTHQMRDMKEALSAMPDIRVDRIDNVRTRVEDGSYHVESDKLARKVVDNVLSEELLKKRGRTSK